MAISQHTGTNDIWIVRLVSKLFYVLSSKNKKNFASSFNDLKVLQFFTNYVT